MKRFISVLITASMLASVLAGCGSTATTEETTETEVTEEADEEAAEAEETEEAAATRIIQDPMGYDVEVPLAEDLDSIVITSFKGAFDAAILLGVTDKVTGMATTTNYPWTYEAFPELAEIKDYGSFNNVSVEELLQDEPDVVISPAMCEELNDQMKELGITVAVDGYSDYAEEDVLAECYAEIDLVATLTGTEDVAERYYEFANSIYELVAERVADIPDEERVTVVPMRTDENEVFCNNYICGYTVEMAGGINLTGDLNGGSGSFYAEIDAEQMLELDPDMIFKINFYGTETQDNLDFYENLANDERYSDITAFKNGDVYLIPTSTCAWNSAAYGFLGVLWMAKIMYPDLFEDIDVKEIAEEFHSEFLNYDLTDEDWEYIAPQFTGANSNGLVD